MPEGIGYNNNEESFGVEVPRTEGSNQRTKVAGMRKRLRNAAAPTTGPEQVLAKPGEHVTDPKRLALSDIDGRRQARSNAADQRRAETKERSLSRDTNLAYRQAIRRNDRAGALRIRQDADNNGVTFGGIRQHGDVGRGVAAARQQGLSDAQARVDAIGAAKSQVGVFDPNQRPGVTPGTFDPNAGAVSQEEAGFVNNTTLASTTQTGASHDVFSKVPNSLRLAKTRTPFGNAQA